MPPTTNPFFATTTGYTGEQSLVDSLVIEQIGMFGIDLMYMPRENVNLDRLLHESTKDVFELALSIPMYIKSFDGYDNSIEILSKFGVRSSDELTLIMSRSQWTTYYAPYVKSYYNAENNQPPTTQNNPLEGEISRRPKEGDLIFFPYDSGIFEVKYVQFDQPFFQLGKGYIYELQCEKFEYSGEDFDTGIPEIDTVTELSDFPNLQFNLDDGGTGTFDFHEQIRIFNMEELPEDLDFFQLYDDPGLIRRVPYVTATVEKWDMPGKKLIVSNLSDLDPEQMNVTTGNVDINKFDHVLIEGQTNNAYWVSNKAIQKPKAFDDAADLQEEFNRIKIYDPADTSPFGFW